MAKSKSGSSTSSEATSKRKTGENGAASSSKRSKASTDSTSTSAASTSLPLGKALASTEKKVRDGAVRSLASFLAQNGVHSLSDLELRKLWKGIFYCFWMSDKPLVQQKLAQQLADLVLVEPQDKSSRAQSGIKFLEAFWDTLISEWAGLDKHRVDKFYLLVRRFVQVGFRLLAEEKWQAQAVSQFVSIFRKPGGALNTNDPNVPDSLTYHLADVYLAELEKALELFSEAQQAHDDDEEEQEDDESDLPLVPTIALLQPFIDALATAKSKQMYQRIWSTVFEPLLDDTLRAAGRSQDQDSEDEDDVLEDEDEEEADEVDEEREDDTEAGDETSNTVFHSFADESAVDHADEEDEASELSTDSSLEEGEDVQFPLLLALSSVPLPTSADEDDIDDVPEVDVALLLRSAIFKSLFVTASQKDATEARRRNLYELWRMEQDRLNDTEGSEQNDDLPSASIRQDEDDVDVDSEGEDEDDVA